MTSNVALNKLSATLLFGLCTNMIHVPGVSDEHEAILASDV
jgi:hypothetical protein